MRSKDPVPPPISHRTRPGRSPHAELPERTIIYCRAPSKRGASSMIIIPYQNLPQATAHRATRYKPVLRPACCCFCSFFRLVCFVSLILGLVLERLRGKGRTRSISEVWKEGCLSSLRWHEWRVEGRDTGSACCSSSPAIT